MFGKLLLLFTIVPVIEIYLLVYIGGEIGAMNTIVVVIITGIAGAHYARTQGAQIIRKIQASLQQGQMPGQELLQGAMILVGGVMLLTPGFLTDIAGLSFLFPLTRNFYAKIASNYFKKRFQAGKWQYTANKTYTDGAGYTEYTEYKDSSEPGHDSPGNRIIDAQVIDTDTPEDGNGDK